MIVYVTLKGSMTLEDLQKAIKDLRRAGCPWTAPVTTAGNSGISIDWAAEPTTL